MISVEKGIVIPPKKCGRGRKARYPWEHMEVGESFFIATEVQKKPTVQQQVSRAGRIYGRRFTTRQVDGGVRVWRIE